ncbi:MAG: RcpC/CpaB family pilus assembly protein [Candidatus Limnocylindria bacterium]
MRTNRGAYVAIFVVASLVAAGGYYLAQPRADAIRARADIAVLTPVTADMVEVVRVRAGDRPTNAATSIDEVIGQYTAMPILAGHLVDRRALESTPGSQAFGFGAPLPAGHAAFAIAVEPAQAVGGALTPGAVVDVVAVPNSLKTLPADAESAPEATVLGEGLVVLALRSVDGRALTDPESTQSATSLPPRLGSVVVAVPAAEVPDFASASLTSTLYLTLNGDDDEQRASP